GETVRVLGDQVVVVAGVVVPALFVGDPTQPQAREIAYREELLVRKKGRGRRAALRIGHFAEQVLAGLGVALFDLDEAREVGRLRPEPAPLGHRRVRAERAVGAAHGFLGAAVHVCDLAPDLFGSARWNAVEIARNRRELLALEGHVDEPGQGPARPSAPARPPSSSTARPAGGGGRGAGGAAGGAGGGGGPGGPVLVGRTEKHRWVGFLDQLCQARDGLVD